MKTGRNRKEEPREELTHVGFKADRVTLEDIEYLTAVAKRKDGVSGKSAAIRSAIHEVAERLRQGK